jgi:hypothetical protein
LLFACSCYTDFVGHLFTLFTYQARDIYEEGMTKVMTVRDFTQIFDAYSQFEESLITNLMNEANTEGIDDDGRFKKYFKSLWSTNHLFALRIY